MISDRAVCCWLLAAPAGSGGTGPNESVTTGANYNGWRKTNGPALVILMHQRLITLIRAGLLAFRQPTLGLLPREHPPLSGSDLNVALAVALAVAPM
jgi:hypothetical protein